MSATILGLPSTTFKAQPDFTATQSENGGWTATQTFLCRTADLDNYAFRNYFTSGKAATALDTTLPSFWSFLRLISLEVGNAEGDLSAIRVSYSGTGIASGGSGEQGEVTTYTLSGTVAQRPLTEHPKVKALGEEDQKKLGLLLDGQIKWDAAFDRYYQVVLKDSGGEEPVIVTFTAGDAATFAGLMIKGRLQYDAPSYQWTEYKERNAGLTTSELNELGKIDTPEGNPPEPGGTRDWRLISATQDFDGSLYRITRVWELSEDGGWDDDIYD